MAHDRDLRSLAMCLLLLCLLCADINLSTETLVSCAVSCSQSLACGWFAYSKRLSHCLQFESLDCELPFETDAMIYKKINSTNSVDKDKQSHIKFQMAYLNRTLCSTDSAKVSCGIPAPMANAIVQYDALEPGSHANYTCVEGFSFCGSSRKEVACLQNGTWSEANGVCYQYVFKMNVKNLKLTCPLAVGAAIEISGIPSSGRFSIKLSKSDYTAVLEIVAVFKEETTDDSVSVRSGKEYKAVNDTFPFRKSKTFSLIICVQKEECVVSVDENWTTRIRMQYPVKIVKLFSIAGFVEIKHVIFHQFYC